MRPPRLAVCDNGQNFLGQATTVLSGDRLRPPSQARIVKKRGSFSDHFSDHFMIRKGYCGCWFFEAEG